MYNARCDGELERGKDQKTLSEIKSHAHLHILPLTKGARVMSLALSIDLIVAY